MKKTLRSKVRIQDVARAAGLSNATVSRVLNGSERVKPNLHERVIKAAVKLGFDLDRRNDSRIVAFLLSNRNVLHPFHSAVLVGAEAHCAANDFGVLFLPLQYSPKFPWRELHIPRLLQNRRVVRGVIAAGTNFQNLLDALTDRRLPIVCLGNNIVGPWHSDKYSAVFFDDIGGAQEATSYLQSLGHRDIWYVGNCQRTWFARRSEGYRRAMEEAGLPPLIRDLNIDNAEDLGYLSTKSILSEDRPITAILAGDDTTARGAYRALADHGLRIPTDVSVVGVNDTIEASALIPPLTSVRVFTDQLGKQMAELLLKQISRLDVNPQVVTLPTRLIRRESCGPVAQGEPVALKEEARAS
ncbi:MAG: LacI family DNA-binding transcriptional regulator [Terriglobia bacterium]|jgi:DNA-binding LacI/PurR family transcriptional regulator